jgi:tetratricopeptide (TPR) repeat protein
MAARGELAHAYRVAGQPEKALPLYERLVTDQDRARGPDHPDTLAARGNLAYAYRSAGRLKDALGLYRRTLADRERIQGRDHPDTITARGNLADTCYMTRKYKEAIPLYERTLADRERIQGPNHPDTIAARGNLASAFHSARKLAQAIPLYEQSLADYERVFGPDHSNTLTSRSNLAHAYHTVGRMAEAQAMFERTLADCERALGPDHPVTQTARENLEAATRVLSRRGPDRGGLGAERLDVARMHLGPPLARGEREPAGIEVVGEPVQAFVPARRVPGRLAEFVEGIQQRERAAARAARQFQADHVGAPAKLDQRLRLVGEHLAVEVRAAALGAGERELAADHPVAADVLREPCPHLLRLGDRPPDLLLRVRQLTGEPQLPAPADLLQLACRHRSSPVWPWPIWSRCRSSLSRLESQAAR